MSNGKPIIGNLGDVTKSVDTSVQIVMEVEIVKMLNFHKVMRESCEANLKQSF